MESTQYLHLPSDDDDEDMSNSFRKKVFGSFVFLKSGENMEEKSFEIFGGENKIGRDAEQSSIVLDTRVRIKHELVKNT